MYRLRIHCAGAVAMVVGLVGCGQQGPKVNYVEGVVTLDGSPLEGATVGFSPVDPKGLAAVGMTDANGVFKLSTVQGGKHEAGAVAGEYYVTFDKSAVPVKSPEELERQRTDPNYGKTPPSSQRPTAPVYKSIVPPAYKSPTTSGFRATVKPGKNTGDEFKFDLKSDYKGVAKPAR